MSRKAATLVQADVARAIRAAKQEGVKVVEVRIGKDAKVVFRLDSEPAEQVNSWDDR